MCMLHTKQQKPVCLYLALRIFREFLNSGFFNFLRSIRGISTFIF